MKSKTLIIAAGLVLMTLTATLIWGHTTSGRKPAGTTAAAQDWLVSGPGRVEPYSEDIKLGAELSGKLKNVYVEEGDRIKAGQILAELQNSDYQAQVASAQAEVNQKQAELRKVINGARRQERAEAWSSVNEAKAVMEDAQSELQRRQELFKAGVVSARNSNATPARRTWLGLSTTRLCNSTR